MSGVLVTGLLDVGGCAADGDPQGHRCAVAAAKQHLVQHISMANYGGQK
jgi:hypothetical protein